MKDIILLVGPPGSGKSSYANKSIPSYYNIICRDDIRTALGVVFEPKLEGQVAFIAQTMGRALMERGVCIVIDETNTNLTSITFWTNLSREYNYRIHAVVMDTPIEECKKRRLNIVPEEVIDRMHSNYLMLLECLDSYFDTVKIITRKD